MTKTWFIADTHFDHKNILEFENRPFSNVDEMKSKMIDAWNAVVGKNDIVYVIGDFCFGGYKAWIETLDQLKGKIILVKGNHDKSKIIYRVLREGFLSDIHDVGVLLREDKYSLNLTHYPLEIGERPFNFNISGHIHSQPNKMINQLNVGVDSSLMKDYYEGHSLPFGTPIPLDEIMLIAHFKNQKMEESYVRGM
ncbi:metallophosphoesterase [Lysinibacillus xylanilyticus]|uniref:metallophosphoesterase n=1 Tax=Lysinibacillus xylanilyticus TaxID=582475 RepID=UPI00382F1250